MSIKIAGAMITDEIVQTIERLQKNSVMTQIFFESIDDITRKLLLNLAGDDSEDLNTVVRLNHLQMIRRDLLTLSDPIDIHDPIKCIESTSI